MSPREARLLAVALALTGLHVLDDATLHREPGTTVADTLTGAGVLLAVLAVSAAAFPRLRAGAQAVLALSRISPRAILLIEAGHGQGGEALNPLYFERAGDQKEHWLIPEASHTGGLEARPEEYERRVVGFFDRYLLGRAPDPS